MKNRILLALAFLLAGHMTIQAQGGMQRRTVEERVKMTMDKMTPQLSLKEDQQSRFSEAYTEFYKGMDKMRQEARQSGNRPDRSAFRKLMEDRDAKIKGILSEEQYAKYTAAVEEMRKNRGGRGRQR